MPLPRAPDEPWLKNPLRVTWSKLKTFEARRSEDLDKPSGHGGLISYCSSVELTYLSIHMLFAWS